MKKKISLLVLGLVSVLVLKTNVYAATTCSSSDKTTLVQEAQNITATYELVEPSTEVGADPTLYYYTIILSGVTENFYYEVGNMTYTYSDAKDGILTVEKAFICGGYKATIKIYGSSKTNCDGTSIRTIKLDIPYYNLFSSSDSCVGYEDLEICKSTTNTEGMSEEEFLSALETEKTKASEESTEEESAEESKNIIDYYIEYKYITIPATIIIVLAIVIIVIYLVRRNRKKIKVDWSKKHE